MRKDLKEILSNGSLQAGVKLSEVELQAFEVFLDEIRTWNRRINLTGIKDDRGIVIKHFLDSLFITPLVSESEEILDVGTGAGFPGIPLKIVKPSLKLTLMEASAKKVGFLKHIRRMLGLRDLNIIKGRAESFKGRMSFDKVVSRATGRLCDGIKMMEGLLRDGGIYLVMKGKRGVLDWESIDMKKKGRWRLEGVHTYRLPFVDIERSVLILRLGEGST